MPQPRHLVQAPPGGPHGDREAVRDPQPCAEHCSWSEGGGRELDTGPFSGQIGGNSSRWPRFFFTRLPYFGRVGARAGWSCLSQLAGGRKRAADWWVKPRAHVRRVRAWDPLRGGNG